LARPLLVVPEGEAPPDGATMIAYDGSPAARQAVAETARLLPGRKALVVHAWESPLRHSVSGRALTGAPLPEIREVTADLESALRETAEATAREGADLGDRSGLAADAEAVESDSSAWRALSDAARLRDAAVVVVGSQGHGLASSVLLGSVSAGLVHHAERPLLVIRAPSP
jgi:nucleotide-binding universal stress UspA family protein